MTSLAHAAAGGSKFAAGQAIARAAAGTPAQRDAALASPTPGGVSGVRTVSVVETAGTEVVCTTTGSTDVPTTDVRTTDGTSERFERHLDEEAKHLDSGFHERI